MDSSKKIKYSLCTMAGINHQDEHMNLICMQEGCTKSKLCCATCFQQQHYGNHKVKTVRKFLEEAEKICNSLPPRNYNKDNLMEQAKSRQKIVKKRIQEHKTLFLKQFQNYSRKVDQLFTNIMSYIEEQCYQYKHILQKSKILISNVKGHQNQCNLAILKLKSIMNDKGDYSTSISEPNHIKIINSVLEATINLQKPKKKQLFKEENQQIQQVIQKFQSQKYIYRSSIKVSQKINLSSRIQSDKFILCKFIPSLSDKQINYNFNIRIKQIGKSKWMAIGACFKSVNQCTFIQKGSKIGNKVYLLISNGYYWSHSINDENGKPIGFIYQNGDVINIKIDLKKCQITFSLKQKHFTVKIKTQQQDQLFPCVVVQNQSQQIEIF